LTRKSTTQRLTETILGQHLALSVAAHLARTQLVPDPLKVYDAQHIGDMVDIVANALARVAPLYVHDGGGAPRQLTEGELEGARVKRSAMDLCLKDGRTLSGISIKRADLRQAIAILKAVGIPELACSSRRPEPPKAQEPDRLGRLRARLAEIEKLLQGCVANLAMRLMSAAHEACGAAAPDHRQMGLMLARLRAALDEAESV
jgi:hypothetical protein